jgi:hypothetical protein
MSILLPEVLADPVLQNGKGLTIQNTIPIISHKKLDFSFLLV